MVATLIHFAIVVIVVIIQNFSERVKLSMVIAPVHCIITNRPDTPGTVVQTVLRFPGTPIVPGFRAGVTAAAVLEPNNGSMSGYV